MKKQILNLGKALKKAEQKEINGGRVIDEGGCLASGALCHTSATLEKNKCCGTCGNLSGSWGICE